MMKGEIRTLIVILSLCLVFSACKKEKSTTELPKESEEKASVRAGEIEQSAAEPEEKAPGNVGGHSHPPLAAGEFPPVPGASLGQSKLFWNEMEEAQCYMLSIEGQEVDWIYAALKTPSALLLFRCETIDDPGFEGSNSPDSVLGRTDDGFYELKKNGGWKLAPVNVPGDNFFSVANPCGDLIAYWADEDETWFAAIYDFRTRNVLAKKKAGSGQFLLETDDPLYLPVPEWDETCSSVVFGSHYYMKEPIYLSLK